MLLLIAGLAGADVTVFSATPTKNGYTHTWSHAGTCDTWSCNVQTNNQIVNHAYLDSVGGSGYWYRRRGFTSFNTSGVSGDVQYAVLKLVLADKQKTDLGLGVVFKFGASQMSDPLVCADTSYFAAGVSADTTITGATILAMSINDTLSIIMRPGWINTSGYTDVFIKLAEESLWCSSTNAVGTKTAFRGTHEGAAQPRLYVYTIPSTWDSDTTTVYTTSNRSGYWRMKHEGGCPGSPTVTTYSTVGNCDIGTVGPTFQSYYRGAMSFDLSSLSGQAADSAKLWITTMADKEKTDWDTDVSIYYGSCKFGNNTCGNSMGNPDTARCTDLLTTLDYNTDMPAKYGATLINLSSAQVTCGGTLDLLFIPSDEINVCAATGANRVKFRLTAGAPTAPLKARLFVWSTAVAGRARIIDIDPGDADLSNPQFIRKESD